MVRKSMITLALLAAGGYALADTKVTLQDEMAMKASAPVTQRTVLSPASTVNYTGTNVGGPNWVRPFADGTCCSGLGPVRYSTQQFYLSANDVCDVASVQDGGWDGYLFVYRSPFDPLAQTVNFVAADDDGNGGIGTSNIDGVALTGATTYTVVTTGFQAGNEGTFTNTISCPTATVSLGAYVAAPPVAAPTMGTISLALLGALVVLIGLTVVRTRGQ